MSVTFTDANYLNLPGSDTSGSSLSDILYDWAGAFTGSHTNIPGTFSGTAADPWYTLGGTALSGTSYSYGSDTDGFKFVATGDLYYYFNSSVTPASPGSPDDHTLFGTLDSVSLYTDSDHDGHADNLFLTVNFDSGITGAITAGQANPVFTDIWGLMNGDPTALLSQISGQGINIDDTFAHLTGSAPHLESDLLLAA